MAVLAFAVLPFAHTSRLISCGISLGHSARISFLAKARMPPFKHKLLPEVPNINPAVGKGDLGI